MNFSNVEDEILILMVQFMVFYLYEQCCETEFNYWIEERYAKADICSIEGMGSDELLTFAATQVFKKKCGEVFKKY